MIRAALCLALFASAFVAVPMISHAQPTQADVYEVTVTSGPDRAFQPQEVTIAVGMWVRWISVGTDSPHHTVTSTDSNNQQKQSYNGVFRGVLTGKGDTFTHSFNEAGTFLYYCETHVALDEMTGQITVTGNDSESSPLPLALALIAVAAAVLAYRRH